MTDRKFFSKANIYPAIWALITTIIGFIGALIWKSANGPDEVVILNKKNSKDTTITIISFQPDQQYYDNINRLSSMKIINPYTNKQNKEKKKDIDSLALSIASEYQFKLDSYLIALKSYTPQYPIINDNLVSLPAANPSFYFAKLKRPIFKLPSIVGGYTNGTLNSYASCSINTSVFKKKDKVVLVIEFFDNATLGKISPLFVELDQQETSNNFYYIWGDQYELKDKKNILTFSASFKPGKYILKVGFYFLNELEKKYPTFYHQSYNIVIE